jgi:hypothetical protein
MNKLLVACISVALLGFAGSAMAAKDAKEIRHCGCYYDSIDGASMVFHDVLVAGNSNGHKNHVVSGEDFDDLCFDGLDLSEEPIYTPFARTAADCEPDGADLDDDIAACTTELESDVCGEEFVGE